MIDIYYCETITKAYGSLAKRCVAIDKFIKNHAYYFGPCTDDYSAEDVYNNILDLMARKNNLINIKVIVDSAIRTLKPEDRKVILLKMHYNISMNEFCGIMEVKQRTAFRRIEHAFQELANALNNSKYVAKLERILDNEEWIADILEDVKTRRTAYSKKEVVNSL